MNSNPIYVIICHGRSGSTLLRRLLNTHSQIYAPSEPWMFFWYHQALNLNDFPTKAYLNFLGNDKTFTYRKFFNLIIKRKLEEANKSIFVEKTPRNNEILDFINELNNNIKYIYLIRDLRAIVNSMLIRSHTFKSLCRNRLTGCFFKNIREVISCQMKIDRFIEKLDDNRLFVMKYEDLVLSPAPVLKSLFKWMDVEFEDVTNYKDEQMIMGDKDTNKHQNPHSMSINKWGKNLLWFEKLYLERKTGEINRAVISTKTSYDSF
jgi:hypothetical protein